MGQAMREKINPRRPKTDDRRRKTEVRGRKTKNGGQRAEDRRRKTKDRRHKTEDGRQEVESDCRATCPAAALSKGRTCCACAHARWLRMAPSVEAPKGCCRHLICINHPAAPGEFREVLGSGTCPNFRRRWELALRTPPPEPPNDSVKYITLTKGKHALVDAADFERLNKHKWWAQHSNCGSSGWYAVRQEGRRRIYMHREVMNVPDGIVVDHIQRNGLDNRQCNLRVCTPLENAYNRRFHSRSSRFQGIRYIERLDKWLAGIKALGRREHIGLFADEIEAAQVRDRWAFAFQGRFAYLNFPADFEGKDPDDPEFQAIRDDLARKRRKREARKKEIKEMRKEEGKGKKAGTRHGAARGTGRRRRTRGGRGHMMGDESE